MKPEFDASSGRQRGPCLFDGSPLALVSSRSPAITALVSAVLSQVRVPIVLEGRVRTPEHVRRAFDLGAHAVVVGTAITGMEWLVRRFVEATPSS